MKKNFDLTVSLVYATFTVSLFLFSFFYNLRDGSKEIYLFLMVTVIFFGFPHGALDTLVAKKNKVFSDIYGFMLFNLSYVTLSLTIFFIWYLLPYYCLIIFLVISAWHFSEDWRTKLNLLDRLILGTSVINFPIFFNPSESANIYRMLVDQITVNNIIKFQSNFTYLLLILLVVLIIKNYNNKILLFQIITIFLSSFFLTPIYYFISYFCFFHSLKNFQETIKELNEKKSKIAVFLIFNTIFTIILGYILFFYFIDGHITYKITNIVFIGLAALTVPHMLLKFYINYKKKSLL